MEGCELLSFERFEDHRPRKLLDGVNAGGAVKVCLDVDELTEANDGVDGFREGSGVVAGVMYESNPFGKTVLYSLPSGFVR